MKNNIIKKLLHFLRFWRIILIRLVQFTFQKRKHKSFINIEKDEHFENSLLRIDYHFDQLLWINFPGIEKKIHNGTVYLQSENITFPYQIEVKTYSRNEKISIDFNPKNKLESEKFAIKNLKNSVFQINHHYFNFKLKKEKSLFINKPIKVNFEEIAIQKEAIKLQHSTFNKNYYL